MPDSRREPSEALVLALQAALVLGTLAAWEAGAAASHHVHFFFSRPSAILGRVAEWTADGAVWGDMGITLAETLLGFLGGVAVGLALAFLCYGSRLADRVLMPFLGVANALPRIVFGPIFVLWFGLGLTSKAVLAASLVAFVVLFATYQGLKEVDPALILRVRLLGGGTAAVARHVLIPSALSWVFTSLRTGIGFALIGAVVGEYLGASRGLGHRIEFAEGMFDSTGIFAGLALLSLMVVVMNGGLEMVERRYRPAAGVEERPAGPGRRTALLAALAVVVALAARSAWVADQEPPAALTRVTMASAGRILGNLTPSLADSLGYFRAEGLAVEIQDLKGGAPAAKALIGGSADFASIALDHALKAKAQGADLVLLATYTRYPGISLVVDSRLEDEVRTVQDLKGKRVGITSPGSGSHLALNALLVKSGMSLDDVEIVAVGTGTMPAAMEQGSIQAAMHYDPFVMQLLLQGKGSLIFDLTTEKDTHWLYGTDYPFLGLLTRREVVRSRPEVVQRMVNATVTAQRFLRQRPPEEVARALPADYGATGDLFLKSLEHTAPSFSPDGRVTPDQVATVLRSLQETGSIPAGAAIDPEDVLDMTFLQRAMAR